MFSEVLKIKPVLDGPAAKKMENDLVSRFSRVARKFGEGLKKVIDGTVIGIGLGLLAKLLNPLQELEDKVKRLIDQGNDIGGLSDRLGASGPDLVRLQAISGSLGVNPDQLKDLLTKFAEGVETARKELADPFAVRSDSTIALKEFAPETNMVKSFEQFLSQLRAKGEGPGRDIVFGEREQRLAQERLANHQTLSDSERQALIGQGLLKPITGLQSRQLSEQAVFGAPLTGLNRSLIEADFNRQAGIIGVPDKGVINKALNNVEKTSAADSVVRARNDLKDFIDSGNKLSSQFAVDIADREAREQDRLNEKFSNFETLQKASKALESITIIVEDFKNAVTEFLAAFGPIFTFFANITKSKWYRKNFF